MRPAPTKQVPVKIVPTKAPRTGLVGATETTPDPAPTTIPVTEGLALWFAADALHYENNESVSLWEDQSPTVNEATSANDAQQLMLAAQPTLIEGAINGLPAVRFDGVDDCLHLSSSMLNTAGTLFCVSKKNDDGTLGTVVLFASGLSLYQNLGPGWGVFADADVCYGPMGSDYKLTTALIRAANDIDLVESGDGGSLINSTDGVAFGHDYEISTIGASQSAAIGAEFAEHYLSGDVAELIFFDRALSTEEREAVEDYLMSKYAL